MAGAGWPGPGFGPPRIARGKRQMRPMIHWIALPGLVAGISTPAWAVTYLSVEQAQQSIFPSAKLEKIEVQLTPGQRKAIEASSGAKVRSPKLEVWKVAGGGWFLVDEVIGKHEFITYAVGLTTN